MNDKIALDLLPHGTQQSDWQPLAQDVHLQLAPQRQPDTEHKHISTLNVTFNIIDRRVPYKGNQWMKSVNVIVKGENYSICNKLYYNLCAGEVNTEHN